MQNELQKNQVAISTNKKVIKKINYSIRSSQQRSADNNRMQ